MLENRDLIDDIRSASRNIIRELGFMSAGLAGTRLPPSAVHALIEIGACPGLSARELAAMLRLEKSSVSRMLRKLVLSGEVEEFPDDTDSRAKRLYLTEEGKRKADGIHRFARNQVASALAQLDEAKHRTVLEGLRTYANALTTAAGKEAPVGQIDIVSGYRAGLVGAVTSMHALYYARRWGFGCYFESVVASGLAEFSQRLDQPDNEIWVALSGDRIVGSIAIDGEHLGKGIAHLRWFIVDDAARGHGLGRKLLAKALAFVDQRDFSETHLWTFSKLLAARHLYERHGFACVEEWQGSQWGKTTQEQRFVRVRNKG